MKKWEEYAVAGTMCLVIAAMLLLWGCHSLTSIDVEDLVEVEHGLLATKVSVHFEELRLPFALILFGCLLLGMGLGILGSVYDFYKLEKRVVVLETKQGV